MKKLPFIALAAALAAISLSCTNDNDTWKDYAEWQQANDAYLAQLQTMRNDDGTPYYTKITPRWDKSSYVLIHWFNDRQETEGNLSPLYNSTIDVRYRLHLYDGVPVDSSDNITGYGKKGIYQCRLDEMIQGWGAALPVMHCGDTTEIIVPYNLGYGIKGQGDIPPFSALRFNVRLDNIANYQTN